MIKAEWTNADALDLQPTCNQLATDTVSRQEAIDALGRVDMVADTWCDEYALGQRDLWIKTKKALEALPSAQQTTCKYWDAESDFCTLYRPSAQPDVPSTNAGDIISRQNTVTAIRDYMVNPKVAISEHPDDILKYNSGLLSAVCGKKVRWDG